MGGGWALPQAAPQRAPQAITIEPVRIRGGDARRTAGRTGRRDAWRRCYNSRRTKSGVTARSMPVRRVKSPLIINKPMQTSRAPLAR